ncbi:VOC family protein [Amycolatopsis sp. FDAARGOS 1241]|uniref:VOC family protein n=1 Tax=Amycolatopsis sp. FDAARGOS 1241 TaxID=2778070 RepID=UPI00194FBEE5|nr:VOC family protein [Amycolatopsis sp. FDAARGOS 1241]QRP45794.1 VOC family protein [Amycolatopsis sp. FDAARGOS 1241]
MAGKFKDLCLDARDHQAVADWWCSAIGYVRRDSVRGEERPEEWPVPIVDPAGEGPLIWVNPVPEGKVVKNRMHLDVWGDPAEFEALEARVVREKGGDVEWWVMADVEGNEFCVFEL